MNEPANDNAKKPRKQRVKGPKAPNKKAQPGAWAAYQLKRAYAIVSRINTTTSDWGAYDGDSLTVSLGAISRAADAFSGLSPEFKAPRRRRAKKNLTDSTDSSNI